MKLNKQICSMSVAKSFKRQRCTSRLITDVIPDYQQKFALKHRKPDWMLFDNFFCVVRHFRINIQRKYL